MFCSGCNEVQLCITWTKKDPKQETSKQTNKIFFLLPVLTVMVGDFRKGCRACLVKIDPLEFSLPGLMENPGQLEATVEGMQPMKNPDNSEVRGRRKN